MTYGRVARVALQTLGALRMDRGNGGVIVIVIVIVIAVAVDRMVPGGDRGTTGGSGGGKARVVNFWGFLAGGGAHHGVSVPGVWARVGNCGGPRRCHAVEWDPVRSAARSVSQCSFEL